jgi:la-related protein 1
MPGITIPDIPDVMASITTKSVVESGSSPAGFSYAQAAKGRATGSNGSVVQSSQATSGANTPSRESTSVTDGVAVSAIATSNGEVDRSVGSVDESLSISVSKLSGQQDLDNESRSTAPGTSSSPSSPHLAASSSSSHQKDENSSIHPAHTDATWQRGTRALTSDHPSDGTERRKNKKTKKEKAAEKEAEKEKEEVKPEILIAAPPPAVNIWQQRKEAQAAAAKPAPQTSPSDSNSNGNAVTTPKSEQKKKGKVTGIEDVEKPTLLAQGSVKDTQPTKSQKKVVESTPRAKDDSTTKRPAPRGSRAADKDEKSAATQLPPPVEDAISWPTPETALEEDKRKEKEKVEKEKEEKDDMTSNKPRPKKEWVTVPYIPSVTFNTPLPTRGTRGGRGGGRGGRDTGARGSHATNGSVSGDKAVGITTSTNATTEGRERGRDNASSGRAASLPPNASKKSGVDASFNSREQRKPGATPSSDKSKPEPAGLARLDTTSVVDARATPVVVQSSVQAESSQQPQPITADAARSEKFEGVNGTSTSEAQSRSLTDRRSEVNLRNGDHSKDSNGHGQPRERVEGRPERGRGAFRGSRGGHNNFPNGQPHAQHAFSNGHPAPPQNSFTRTNSGPYSPPLSQSQYPNTFAPNSNRGGRGGPSRSQSIPNGNGSAFGRYPPNVGGQMAPLQTGGMFDYMPPMSAVPFNPYVDQYSVLAMVAMQLEYYFSIDNLCKDVFLRKHLDSKGFVSLTFIAGFKRIQSLTQDFDLLKFACQESEIIEIVTGDDNIDRIRRQDGWEKWVLPVEERDEGARNDGPERFHRRLSHRELMAAQMMPQNFQAMSPPAFSPNGTAPSFRQQNGPGPLMPNSNGFTGYNDPSRHTESPLSAAVADFAPGVTTFDAAGYAGAETTFTDTEVDNLNLVYNNLRSNEDTKPKTPFHTSSSRTFSNGSIDGRSITEELQELEKRQGRTLASHDNRSSDM